MNIPVRVEPSSGPPSEVEYRWDVDTDILTAVMKASQSPGEADTLEIEGQDGSWLVLDLRAGRVNGVEVAVWPDVRKRTMLRPPPSVELAQVHLGTRSVGSAPGAFEVDVPVSAEADDAEATIHFRLGSKRAAKTVGIARDILLELDARNHIAGLWLLNVPPLEEAE